VGTLAGSGSDPLLDLDFIRRLPSEKKIELAKRRSAWQLSQFLHGEQGAMLCAGQLVEAVPDMDGKLYAATQVIDEARHVEVFHRYIQRLGRVYPIMPGLKSLLNAVLTADLWQMKCVGMQVIAESLAMGSFKMMREGTHDELLKKIVELTAKDEARHISYGLIYMKEELPRMDLAERDKVEDFALAGVSLLASPEGQRQSGIPMFEIFQELGIDLEKAAIEMEERFSDPEVRKAMPNPFRDYVYPQLKRINLITDRTAAAYEEMGMAA
jgi:hypothetical protein